VVQFRLFREACVQHYGNYVKDLTHLGRALESSIIVDNSPFSYMFQSGNSTWLLAMLLLLYPLSLLTLKTFFSLPTLMSFANFLARADNAIPITSWFDDKNDRQLYVLLPKALQSTRTASHTITSTGTASHST
jgi:TFIIF-interacting CTD phosphatase-like protein